MLPNSNCKLPNIEVAELAVYGPMTLQKCVVFCKQNSCHLKSERAWAISLTPGLRRTQKCTARPGRRPRCGGWQYVEQGINLNASDMRWQMGLDQWKPNLLGSPLKDCPSTLMSFCKFSDYTEWWWCVKVKTVRSMMPRNVPKVAHCMFQ